MYNTFKTFWSFAWQFCSTIAEVKYSNGITFPENQMKTIASIIAFSGTSMAFPACAVDYTSTVRGNFTFTEDSTVTTSGTGAYGLYTTNGTSINSLYNVTVLTLGQNAGGINAAGGMINLTNADVTTTKKFAGGLLASNAGAQTSTINSSGNVTVNISGDNASAIRTGNNGYINLNNVDVTTTGASSNGLYATGASAISILGTTIIHTSGNNSPGVYSTKGTLSPQRGNISLTTVNITTTGNNSSGVVAEGSNSVIGLDDGSISTTGTNSHGFLALAGARKTFDGQADNMLPSITVSGDGSAVVASSGANSNLIVAGNTALTMANTTGVNTWGAMVENGGALTFQGNSRTGGTGLWVADASSSITLTEYANAAGSLVRLNDGVLNTNNSTQIGTLAGTAASRVNSITPGGTLTLGSDNATHNGSLVDNANFAGKFINLDLLTKTGTLTQVLSGTDNTVGSVNVAGGVLQFEQNGAFTTSGDYTTQGGATTRLGQLDSTLAISGTFTQAVNSLFEVTLDATHPMVTADSAQLSGLFKFNGFVANALLPITASEVVQRVYTLIHTTHGVSGDFDNSQAVQSDLDYLLRDGHISADNKDYNIGFRMAWNSGDQALGTGSFTVKEDTAFDVDTQLADQTVPVAGFSSTWDGKSLTKNGDGLLVLSAANTYTGGTTLTGGTLALRGAGTLGESNGTTTITGGELDLGDTIQTQATLNQLAGYVQNGTLNLGNYQLSGGSLASDATVNASNLFDFRSGTVNGVLSGNGALQKTTSGIVTVAGAGSQVGSVDVMQGTMQFSQNGKFTTSGNYTTQNGAATNIGPNDSTLAVGNVFTQQAGATLQAILDDEQPLITATKAELGGVLRLGGFVMKDLPVKASDLVSRLFTLIQTTDGINGNFTNFYAAQPDMDYLLRDGHISADGNSYNLGVRLAWTQGGASQATGQLTLAFDTAIDIDIPLADQTAPSGSFDSGWDGKSLAKSGDGLLVLSAVNTYTGSTTLNDGTLRTDMADTFASSSDVIVNGGVLDLNGKHQQASRLAGTGGQIVLNGAMLTASNATGSDDSTFAGDIVDGSTKGSLTKTGEGTLTLSGTTGWTGDTRIDGGELVLDGSNSGAQLVSNIIGQDNTALTLRHGATLTGWIDPTDVNIDSASTWNMTADSLVDDVTLTGTINFASPSSSPMSREHTLTASNWTGQDGTVVLNTVLANDSSVTDKIVVNGDTSGNTFVQVNNAGGGGAQTVEGIRVVEVHGQSDGTFMKAGRIVAGAYDYNIVQKGSDWYLTSQYITPASDNPSSMVRPESGSYTANLAAANIMFITSLHDRLGETQYTDVLSGEKKVTSMWLRQQGGHNRWSDASSQLDTQSNRYTVQLGGEVVQWSPDGLQRWHLGMMAGYGTNSSNTDSDVTGYRSEGNIDGYSAGIYATWYENDETKQGMYVDSWAQYNWFNNEVKGQNVQSESYQSSGMTASVELGYTHKLGEFTGCLGSLSEWYIQPQAQAIWMGVKADNHRESSGTYVSGEGDGNLQTRLGARTYLKGYSKIDEGTDRTFQLFVEVNWIHNTQNFGTQMDGMGVYQTGARNIGEVKTGVEGQLSPRFTLWGNIGGKIGDIGYNDTFAMLGGKYSF